MYIIVNINTNRITQSIDKNEGIRVNDNELIQEIADEVLDKIKTAYEYDLIFTDGEVTDINVIQTIDEYEASLPPIIPVPTTDDYLIDLDFRLSMIELGL